MGWFGGGLTWQVYVIYVIQMLLNSFFKSSYYHKNILWVLRKWFGVVKMWFGVVWWWFGVVWGVLGWFGVFPRTDVCVCIIVYQNRI